MNKLQTMMAHFGERNKAARGRQEDVMRMLRDFVEEIDQRLQVKKEKDERIAKQAKKGILKNGVSVDGPPSTFSPVSNPESSAVESSSLPSFGENTVQD